MEQYINKAAAVAEIERRRDLHYKYYVKRGAGSIAECKYEEDRDILDFLDTLEVKNIDLEDNIKESLAQEYINYIFKRHNIDPESKEGQLIYYAYIHGINQCLNQLKT